MRPLSPVPPCQLVARRRVQLLGGATVSAVVLASVLAANPALASTHPGPSGVQVTSKSQLGTAFRAATGTDATVQLGSSLTDASDDDDLLVLGAGTALTVDLNGKDLNVDRIVLNASSSLAIIDTAPTRGHLVLGGASTTQDGDATGIKVGSGATLDIDGASVDSTGSTSAAGIGGAADGTVTAEGGAVVAARGGANAAGIGGGKNGNGLTVHVHGASVSATGGTGAAGVGGGFGGNGGAVDVTKVGSTAGSITAANGTAVDGSTGSAIGAGAGGTMFGTLIIDGNSTVTTAPSSSLRIPAGSSSSAQVTNAGTLAVGGTASGSGTIANSGTVTGSVADTLNVTGNDFLVTFDLNGGAGGTLPATKRVLGPTLAAGGVDIDTAASHPEKSGWTFFRWETGSGSSLLEATDALGLAPSAGQPDESGRQAITIKAAYKRKTTTGAGTLPVAVRGVAYTGSVAVASGDASVRYSLKTGSTLPHNLVLNATTGAVTGTPDVSSPDGATFTIVATADPSVDAPREATYSIRVGAAPQLSDGARSSGIVGTSYAGPAVHADGDGTISYAVTSGALPAGLTLGANGSFAGAPTAGGTFSFSVTAHSEFGADSVGRYTLVVNTVPVFRSTTLAPATLGVGYNASAAADGDGTITYSIVSGSLPDRLSLNSATGTIAGTVTRAGASIFTVKAHSQYGDTTQAYTFAAGPVPAILTDGTLPSVTSGAAVSATLTANGDSDHPVTFTADGRLPGTLHLSAAGALTGTVPVASGQDSRTVTFTVTAESAYGTIDKDFTLSSYTAPSVATGTSTKRAVGTAFTTTLTADGYGVKTWSVSTGQLPAGVVLNSTTGVLSGTPTTVGTSHFSVKATSSYGEATADYTITTGFAPTVTTTSAALPTATVNSQQPYAAQLAASGTEASAASWRVSDGQEPAGLTVHADGSITGTATSGAAATFTVEVTTDFGTDTRQLTIDPGAAPTISTGFTSSALTGQPYSQRWTAPSGDGTSRFVLTGSLPDGLTFANGTLSGTPTEIGSFAVTVTAINDFGSAATQLLTLSVSAGPALSEAGLADAVLGIPYLARIGATHVGFFTTDDDDLPPGLHLNQATGEVSGVATATGTSTFEVRGYLDSTPFSGLIILPWLIPGSSTVPAPLFPLSSASVVRTYSISVGARTTLDTGALPDGTVGAAYSVPVIANGDGPHAFAVTDGTLPDGLLLNEDTGIISGAPTGAGSSTFTVTATGAHSTDSVELTISVAAAAVLPTPAASTPAAAVPAPSVSAPAPVASKPAPVVSTPAAPTPVVAAPVPVLPSLATTTARFGHPVALSVAASSATKVAYSLAGGDLPKGVALDGATGVISGTPTEVGTFTATVQATNAAGSSTTSITIVVPTVQELVQAKPATSTLRSGAPVTFTIKGLKKGEAWSVKVDGKVKLRGEAKKAGNLAVSVPLPKSLRDKEHTVKVSGSRAVSDPAKRASTTFTVTTVSARKSLVLKADGRSATLSKLAAGEKVMVVLSDRTVVARGAANADGVFAFSLQDLSKGRHTLLATGSTDKRTAKLKVVLG